MILGVLLTILKVIGITLLVILGIVLILLLLLLFVPVKYKGHAEYNEEKKEASIKLSWLFHIIHANGVFKDKQFNMKIRLFGICIKQITPGDKDSEDEDDIEEFEEEDVKDSAKEEKKKLLSSDEIKEAKEKKERHKKLKKDKEVPAKETSIVDLTDMSNTDMIPLDIDDKSVEKGEYIWDKVLVTFFKFFDICLHGFFKGFDFILNGIFAVFGLLFIFLNNFFKIFDKVTIPKIDTLDKVEGVVNSAIDKCGKISGGYGNFKVKLRSIKDTIANVLRKIGEIKGKISGILGSVGSLKNRVDDYSKLAKTKRFKKTFAFAKKLLINLLKHILPRKMKGYFKYGFEEPDKTGKIYGYICIFFGLLGKKFKKFEVTPVFDQKIIEGSIDFKGHIRLIHVLVAGIKILLNRNIWIIKKKFDKINEKYKKEDDDDYEEVIGA